MLHITLSSIQHKDPEKDELGRSWVGYSEDKSIEELYELFEAPISCCCTRTTKIGVQVKASKTKLGVEKVTFHNHTITCEGTQPKDANLCPIRNMTSLSNVSQVRAFLGCCQKMSQYIKGYGITAAPLHGLTKEARAFSKPWFKGED